LDEVKALDQWSGVARPNRPTEPESRSKTLASKDYVPLAPVFQAALEAFRNGKRVGLVFPSHKTDGCYFASEIQKDHLRPAAPPEERSSLRPAVIANPGHLPNCGIANRRTASTFDIFRRVEPATSKAILKPDRYFQLLTNECLTNHIANGWNHGCSISKDSAAIEQD
jgi:hypothetical protein